MFMCRKSMYAHLECGGTGVAAALARRALALLNAAEPRPAPLVALLTALASVMDAVLPPPAAVHVPTVNTTPAVQRLKRLLAYCDVPKYISY